MAKWHRQYNLSGTVRRGNGLEDWCRVPRASSEPKMPAARAREGMTWCDPSPRSA
jgi:hypothetical protein